MRRRRRRPCGVVRWQYALLRAGGGGAVLAQGIVRRVAWRARL
jgi:hypothetical protein